MKKVLRISLMVALIAGMAVLLAFTDQDYQHSSYRSFRIDILNPSDHALITLDEIKALVKNNFGEITGSPMIGVNLVDLENTVLANPYVSSCEVFQTIDGGLVMKAMVREPLVRIVNTEGQQYYLDNNGWAMPITASHPSLVIVANGNITDKYFSLEKSEKPLSSFPTSSNIRKVYLVALHISRDNFLKSFIDQIYVNDKNEIELVPKIGSQQIIFGNADDVQEKLENLKVFYEKVMSRMDWTVYKSINLKYKNQIVCSK
jgi:cell division protein FtsQ